MAMRGDPKNREKNFRDPKIQQRYYSCQFQYKLVYWPADHAAACVYLLCYWTGALLVGLSDSYKK